MLIKYDALFLPGDLHSAMVVRGNTQVDQSGDEEALRSSTVLQMKELKHTQLRVQESSKKMKELSINIRYLRLGSFTRTTCTEMIT